MSRPPGLHATRRLHKSSVVIGLYEQGMCRCHVSKRPSSMRVRQGAETVFGALRSLLSRRRRRADGRRGALIGPFGVHYF